jgi:hypothetical protein
MYTVPNASEFHATKAHPIVNVNAGDATKGFKIALAVEVPLMLLALSTVILRLYSRLAIKKKLAPDDILILLGTVSQTRDTTILSLIKC